MIIHIQDLRFQCIIGILDFERETPQDVVVDLTIEYDYKKDFINYAVVADMVKKNMIENKYLLIEEALDGLKTILSKEFKLIDKLDIKLTKPSILPDCKVSVSNKY